MPGGPGQTSGTPYKIQVTTDTDDGSVAHGDIVTYTVVTDGTAGTTADAAATGLTGIQWDFDSAQPGSSNTASAAGKVTADRAMDRVGTCVVKAAFSDAQGQSRTLTVSEVVAPQGVSVAHHADLTVDENQSFELAAAATVGETGSTVTSVEWWYSWDGEDYERDTSLTALSQTTSLKDAGEYSVWVKVTDSNGLSAEDEFAVTVSPAAPGARATVDPTRLEGQEATFVVYPASPPGINATFEEWADPDADPRANIQSIYVDWNGGSLLEGPPVADAPSPFEEVSADDWTFNRNDGSIAFRHRYDDDMSVTNSDGTHSMVPLHPVIRIEDEEGLTTTLPPLTLPVWNVAPAATLHVGTRFSTVASSGEELWKLPSDSEIWFDGISDPSDADFDTLTYHWRIDGADYPTTFESSTSLKNLSAQKVHTVEAWVQDKDGGEGTHQSYNVVAHSPTLGAVAPDSIYGTILLDGQKPRTGTASTDGPGGPTGAANVANGAANEADAKDPDDYSPYYYGAHAIRKETNGVHTVSFVPDAAGMSVGPLLYSFQVTYSDLVDNSTIGTPVTVTGTSSSFTTRAIGDNERATVWVNAYKGDGTPPRHQGWQMASFEGHRVQTFVEQINEMWGLFKQLTDTFAEDATALWKGFKASPTKFFDALLTGTSDALKLFLETLPTTGQAAICRWLTGNVDSNVVASTALANPLRFALDALGLGWKKLDDLISQELGGGNSLAVEGIRRLYQGYDQTDSGTLLTFLDDLKKKPELAALSPDAAEFLKTLDLNEILTDALKGISDSFKDALPEITIQVLAKFLPGTGAVSAVIGGFSFLAGNYRELFKNANEFLAVLKPLAALSPTGVRDKMLVAMTSSIPLFLKFGARQFGLNKVADAIRLNLNKITNTFENTLRGGLGKLASKMGSGTGNGRQAIVAGNNKSDSLIGKAITLTDVACKPGQTYRLTEVQTSGKPELKLEEVLPAGQKAQVWKLNDKSFLTAGAWATDINKAAKDYLVSLKAEGPDRNRHRPTVGGPAGMGGGVAKGAGGSSAAGKNLRKSGDLQKVVQDKLVAIAAEIVARGVYEISPGCFAAGTMLRTPTGLRAIEAFASGDEILSQDEHDPRKGIVTRRVEEVFRRYARVLGVHLRRDGEESPFVVRSTSEHPFFVSDPVYLGKWVAAGELVAGMWVLCDDGAWARVEEVADHGEWEVVYNMRVADAHTYFVGEAGRGYAVWVHNSYDDKQKKGFRLAAKAVWKAINPEQNSNAFDSWINYWWVKKGNMAAATPDVERFAYGVTQSLAYGKATKDQVRAVFKPICGFDQLKDGRGKSEENLIDGAIEAAYAVPQRRRKLVGNTPGRADPTGIAVLARMRAESRSQSAGGSTTADCIDENLAQLPVFVKTTTHTEKAWTDEGNQTWVWSERPAKSLLPAGFTSAYYKLEKCDMGHKIDAVVWWNGAAPNGGKYLPREANGDPGTEIRLWMNDQENYHLQYRKHNQSAGGSLSAEGPFWVPSVWPG